MPQTTDPTRETTAVIESLQRELAAKERELAHQEEIQASLRTTLAALEAEVAALRAETWVPVPDDSEIAYGILRVKREADCTWLVVDDRRPILLEEHEALCRRAS